MSCLLRFLVISGFFAIRIDSTGGYEIFCRDGIVGVPFSSTECFLEENNAVTHAFTYEIISDDDGTLHTSTQDCKVQRTGPEIQFPPGCPLDHLAHRRRRSSYETVSGGRVVERNYDRPFRKVEKLAKSSLESQIEAQGLTYRSDSPPASLEIKESGQMTWVQAAGPVTKIEWLRTARQPDIAASRYFKLSDGTIGFFTADQAITLGESITVSKRTYPTMLDRQEISYQSTLAMDIKRSSSGIEDTGVDYPPETSSFYNHAMNVTFCEFDDGRFTPIVDHGQLTIAVNDTTVATDRAYCPRLGDRPAFQISFYSFAVFLRYLPHGVEKQVAPTRVFDPFTMVKTSEFRHQLNRLHSAVDEMETPQNRVFKKHDPVMKELIEGVCSAVITSIKEIFTFEEVCRAYTYLFDEGFQHEYRYRDGLVGVLSTTECFLEENNAVTRAFTYEVTSNGDGTLRTSTQDCKVQRTGPEIQFPSGCPLDHLARRRRPSYYNKTGNGARVLEREYDRPFRKVGRLAKSSIVSQNEAQGHTYTSDSPPASLEIKESGEMTWVQAAGLVTKIEWLRTARQPDIAASRYFKLSDGTIGFFTADQAVTLGESITVLKRNSLTMLNHQEIRNVESPINDEEPPPK
ncbi:hypothetical protein FOZ60_009339 [Perkinsus olseni]|uniref:Uncharacterized protein n=1 Tax=Perkinsus olseni TaxID=32597 RepID=A0A7J6NHM2_PEROL|nr:hypothetical protein FOZ60_009339 [Perkinsus olseni]